MRTEMRKLRIEKGLTISEAADLVGSLPNEWAMMEYVDDVGETEQIIWKIQNAFSLSDGEVERIIEDDEKDDEIRKGSLFYKDIIFETEEAARWAVFLDLAGIKWIYTEDEAFIIRDFVYFNHLLGLREELWIVVRPLFYKNDIEWFKTCRCTSDEADETKELLIVRDLPFNFADMEWQFHYDRNYFSYLNSEFESTEQAYVVAGDNRLLFGPNLDMFEQTYKLKTLDLLKRAKLVDFRIGEVEVVDGQVRYKKGE